MAKTVGTIFGSVFITLLLVGVGGYFGLPMLFPNLNEDLGEYAKTDDITDEGILLQTKFLEVDTDAYISDSAVVDAKMADTEFNITTTGNSKLLVAFDAMFLLHLDAAFSGATRYNITLVLAGVQNRTTRISYFTSPGLGTTIEETYSVHLTFETGILTADTYSLAVYWKSITDTTEFTQLIASGGGFVYTRSLTALEIAG